MAETETGDTLGIGLIEHVLIALTLQCAVGLATRNWWAGGLASCSYFVGRELAQAEYRWIEQFGDGRRSNATWWAAFDWRAWTTIDQVVDIVGPIIACTLLWLAMRRKPSRI